MNKYILLAITLFSTPLLAKQKYNPFTNHWETVPSDWQTQYNPFDNTWSYQPKNAKIEYNPFENTWDWNSGHNDNSYCMEFYD